MPAATDAPHSASGANRLDSKPLASGDLSINTRTINHVVQRSSAPLYLGGLQPGKRSENLQHRVWMITMIYRQGIMRVPPSFSSRAALQADGGDVQLLQHRSKLRHRRTYSRLPACSEDVGSVGSPDRRRCRSFFSLLNDGPQRASVIAPCTAPLRSAVNSDATVVE